MKLRSKENVLQRDEIKSIEKSMSNKSQNQQMVDSIDDCKYSLPKQEHDPELMALVSSSRNRTKYKTFMLSSSVFEVEQRYRIKEVIGHGAYGTVCGGMDLFSNQSVAIKKIENIFAHKSLAKRTLRELKLLRYFKHENIMRLSRVMRPHKSDSIYMVSELMETDLAMVIRSPQALTDEHIQFFIYQVLRGLKYIHSASVIHRDLKPRNLLVNSSCDLKICDFGLARIFPTSDGILMSNYIATRWYRAPEVILSRARYTQAVDMWALGCILAELFARRPLFPGRDSFHQISLITSILGSQNVLPENKKDPGTRDHRKYQSFVCSLPKRKTIPLNQVIPNLSPLALDLLAKLLVFNPNKRFTVEEALEHPYLKDLHLEDDEPICQTIDMQDFYFENFKTSKEDLRLLTRQEILCHYPEDTFQLKNEPAFQFNSQMKVGGQRNSFP